MKKHSTKIIFILLISFLVVAARAFWTFSGGEVRSEKVFVSQVYDGDTIVVSRGPKQTAIRLIGVDTPEISRPDTPVEFYGPEAADFTRRMLEGAWVRLEFESPDRPGGPVDQYGRTLAYVITEDGKNFDLELVRKGYGRVFDKYPFRYLREFEQAQRAAQKAGLGIWDTAKRTAWSDPRTRGKIIGNIRSHIYHLPGQYGYDKVREKNRAYFKTEEEAQNAGFRRARN
jgi:micrococcal nuclease